MAYQNLVVEIQKLVENGSSVDDACCQYGKEIGKTQGAVRMAYYRRKQPGGVHGNACLTDQEHKTLLYIAIALVNIQRPWTLEQMHKAAEDMFSKKISLSTIRRFLKQHSSDLGLGITTPLSAD